MHQVFKLEVTNDSAALGLLEGDEVVYAPYIQPRNNGRELAVLEVLGKWVVAPFVKFGNQYIILGDQHRAFKQQQVRIIGKVIEGMHETKEPAVPAAGSGIQSVN